MLRMRIRGLQMSATLLLFGLLLASADIASAQVVLTESFELPNTANFQTFNAGQTLVGASASWSITTNGGSWGTAMGSSWSSPATVIRNSVDGHDWF